MQESQCGFALDSCQAGCLGQPWDLSRRKSKASGQMPRVLERCQKGGGFSHIKTTTGKKRPSVGAGGRLKEPVKPPTTESTLINTKPPKHKAQRYNNLCQKELSWLPHLFSLLHFPTWRLAGHRRKGNWPLSSQLQVSRCGGKHNINSILVFWLLHGLRLFLIFLNLGSV